MITLKDLKAIPGAKITTTLNLETGIIKVVFTTDDLIFMGQYDEENKGIYGWGIDDVTMEGLLKKFEENK